VAGQARADDARQDGSHLVYGADIDDPALYHLQIDSTALPLDVCAALIVAAYRPRRSPPAQR
jgi:hypothetical protein